MQRGKIAGPLAAALVSGGLVLLIAASAPPSDPAALRGDPGSHEPPAAVESNPSSASLPTPSKRLAPVAGRFVAQRDETLEALAERIYGRRDIAPLLARAGLPENPQEGQPLELPLAQEIRLPRGANLSTLARKHLGDGKRWPVLAALSGIEDAHRCRTGTRIILPAGLRIRVRSGDSLSKLSQLAWGSPKGGNLIALWNDLPADSWLTKGRWIEVPLAGPLHRNTAAAR